MKIKNVVLGIGIVVIFALTLWQGVEAFYPSPQWNDYCDHVNVPKALNGDKPIQINQERCLDFGGMWEDGDCDYYSKCQSEYDSAMNSHSQTVFFISLIVAIIVFILGYSLLSVEPVGSALTGAGIWSVFYGTVINWRNFSDIWRFLILISVLILLIWFALKINKKKKGFWFNFGFR